MMNSREGSSPSSIATTMYKPGAVIRLSWMTYGHWGRRMPLAVCEPQAGLGPNGQWQLEWQPPTRRMGRAIASEQCMLGPPR